MQVPAHRSGPWRSPLQSALCLCACAHACRHTCTSTLVEHSPDALVHTKCFNRRALPCDDTQHPWPGAALRGSAADAPAFLLGVKRPGGCLTGASRGLTRDHSGVGSLPLRLVASFVPKSCRNLTFSSSTCRGIQDGEAKCRRCDPCPAAHGWQRLPIRVRPVPSNDPECRRLSLRTTLGAAPIPTSASLRHPL